MLLIEFFFFFFFFPPWRKGGGRGERRGEGTNRLPSPNLVFNAAPLNFSMQTLSPTRYSPPPPHKQQPHTYHLTNPAYIVQLLPTLHHLLGPFLQHRVPEKRGRDRDAV